MHAFVLISAVQNPEENLSLNGGDFVADEENEIPNDFDLRALEAAVSLKENGVIGQVTVFSAAPRTAHIVKALAMGADRAVWALAPESEITPLTVALTAAQAVKRLFPDDFPGTVWFLGKLGVNYESRMTAQILADLCQMPCIRSASRIGFDRASDRWIVETESEFGATVFEQSAPFAVTADLRLAEPRFPSLPNIVKARKKPIVQFPLVSASDDFSRSAGVLSLAANAKKQCAFIDAPALARLIRGDRP